MTANNTNMRILKNMKIYILVLLGFITTFCECFFSDILGNYVSQNI